MTPTLSREQALVAEQSIDVIQQELTKLNALGYDITDFASEVPYARRWVQTESAQKASELPSLRTRIWEGS